MDKKIALNNLKEITDSLKKFNCKHWLTDGTLLGYYREKDFISHDLDTDLGIDWNSFDKNSIYDILKKGFKIKHIFGYVDSDGFEIALEKNGVKTDLFFFYEKDDKYYHSAYIGIGNGMYNKINYLYDKFNLKEDVFLGEKFYVPENPLTFIETKYGSTWETPDKNWNWAFSPKNHQRTKDLINLNEANKKFKEWIS